MKIVEMHGDWLLEGVADDLFAMSDDEVHTYIDCYDLDSFGYDRFKAALGIFLVECLLEKKDSAFLDELFKWLTRTS